MGEWSEYFEDFPEENPANWINGRFDPNGATIQRVNEKSKRQASKESQALQQKMFVMAEEAKRAASMRTTQDKIQNKDDEFTVERTACQMENRLRTNFVLVDYENVQPKDLGLLRDGPFKVKVFFGPNQSKIPVALASTLQSLGSNAEYVVLETAGANALDFHIAYYMGVLSQAEPSSFFHIISKDTGFDPLIKHLKGKKVFAQRSTCISDIPYFKPSLPAAPEAQIEVVIEDLVRRKASKPRTQKTLLSTLHALFKKELSEQQLAQLFTSLCNRGIVKVDGTKVSYELPA